MFFAVKLQIGYYPTLSKEKAFLRKKKNAGGTVTFQSIFEELESWKKKLINKKSC